MIPYVLRAPLHFIQRLPILESHAALGKRLTLEQSSCLSLQFPHVIVQRRAGAPLWPFWIDCLGCYPAQVTIWLSRNFDLLSIRANLPQGIRYGGDF